MFNPRIFLLFTLLLSICSRASAINVIRDSELEEAIELIVTPLKTAAKIPDLRVHILDDIEVNAFTPGGRDIFVTAGLIINYPDPDILRGVLAHELGHIIGHHMVQKSEAVENYKKAAVAATILGVTTAFSGNASGAIIAAVLGGTHMAERSMLAYSRDLESSADQIALKLLEQSKNSSIGLIKFFETNPFGASSSMVEVYDSTHPMDRQRLLMVKQANKISRYPKSTNSDELLKKYERSSVKLAAYIMDVNSNIKTSFSKHSKELDAYVKAIKAFRSGKTSESIDMVNKLIAQEPNNPYYHELKGQIYLESNNKLALDEYIIASKSRPNDRLLKMEKSIAALSLYQNDANAAAPYVQDLNSILSHEPDNLLAHYYLASYYEKHGDNGKSYYHSGAISAIAGREEEANKMLKSALKLLPKDSVYWYKASDLLDSIINA